MKFVHMIGAICLLGSNGCWTVAQDVSPPGSPSTTTDANPVLKHRMAESPETSKPILRESIDLTLPKGTALQVVLDQEIRVQKLGQPIHGHLVEPVYTFDKLVLPVGTEVAGQISQIDGVSGEQRTLAALDANLTPRRKITVEFMELFLKDGKHLPIQTSVVAGSGQVIRFVTPSDKQKKKGVKDVVTEKERQAKEEARRQFDSAMQQVKEPGKLHRVKRYAVAQLPVHPQYIDAGTMYFAELERPMTVSQMSITETTPSPQHKLHWLAEQALNWSGLSVVHVRPTVFLEGFFLTLTPDSVRESDQIRLPFGEGKTSPVAAEDVARVIAALLANPQPHIGKIYHLTGPQSENVHFFAQEYSKALGRTITFQDIPVEPWRDELLKRGWPVHLVNHLAAMGDLHRAGRFDRKSDDVLTLTGQPPLSVQEFVRRNAAAFTAATKTKRGLSAADARRQQI